MFRIHVVADSSLGAQQVEWVVSRSTCSSCSPFMPDKSTSCRPLRPACPPSSERSSLVQFAPGKCSWRPPTAGPRRREPGCQAAELDFTGFGGKKKNAAVNPNVNPNVTISQPKRMIHRYSEYILSISIIIPCSVLKLIDHQGLLVFPRPWTHRP